MSLLENLRRLKDQLIDAWYDRDIIIPRAKEEFRSLPSRFRQLEPGQKKFLIAIIVFIFAIQAGFFLM